MNLLLPWLVFPFLLALLTIGCGLLVETIAGHRLPAAPVPPLGLARETAARPVKRVAPDNARSLCGRTLD